MLTIAYPWLSLVVFLPILVWYFVPAKLTRRSAVRIPFMSRVVDAGASNQNAVRKSNSLTVRLGVWILIVVSLAKPQWLENPVEKIVPTRDLMLIVDLSGSMDHQDFESESGEKVNRLTAVKRVLGDFLTRRKGDRVGLIVFGNAPFLQVPLTTDLELSRLLLDETTVGMAGPRTAFGDAIGLGIKLLEDSESPEKTIIALTDGNDTSSSVPPIQAARVARDRNITIHAVAIGDPTALGEDPLDESTLKAVAKTSGGEYFFALDSEQLSGIYDQLDKVETTEIKTNSYRPRRELYFWPLATALLLSLFASLIRLIATYRESPLNTPIQRRLRVNTRTFELETVDQ